MDLNSNNSTRHSDEIQVIISRPPSWLLKWGVTISLIVIALTVYLASIISYPDMINARLTINQYKNGTYYGTIFIPQKQIYDIKSGQKLIIKVDAYPFDVFGSINGSIISIPGSPNNQGTYTVLAALYEVTNKRIKLNTGLTADAQVILNNRTILKRIADGFVYPGMHLK